MIDFKTLFKRWSYTKTEDHDNFKNEISRLTYQNGCFSYNTGETVILNDNVSQGLVVDDNGMCLNVKDTTDNDGFNTIFFLDDRIYSLKIIMSFGNELTELSYSYSDDCYNYDEIINGETLTFSMPPYSKTVDNVTYYCTGWKWEYTLNTE